MKSEGKVAVFEIHDGNTVAGTLISASGSASSKAALMALKKIKDAAFKEEVQGRRMGICFG